MRRGVTPLEYAVLNEQLYHCRALLVVGAKVEVGAQTLQSLVALAQSKGNVHVVECLQVSQG